MQLLLGVEKFCGTVYVWYMNFSAQDMCQLFLQATQLPFASSYCCRRRTDQLSSFFPIFFFHFLRDSQTSSSISDPVSKSSSESWSEYLSIFPFLLGRLFVDEDCNFLVSFLTGRFFFQKFFPLRVDY